MARFFCRSHLPTVVVLSLFFGTNLVVGRFTLGQMHPLVYVAVRLPMAAGLALTPAGVAAAGFDLSRVQWSGVAAIIYGSLSGTLVGFLLYSFLVARYGPTKATQTEYLVPIVTVVTGAIFLGERVSPIVITGMIVALSGIAIATWRRPIKRRGSLK